MSSKRKISADDSPENEVSLLEDQELGLLQNNVSLNDPRIKQLHARQLELYRSIYSTQNDDSILYDLRLHSRNSLNNPDLRMYYLNQIVNHRRRKRSTFTFSSSSENSNTNTNTNTNTTPTQLTREQLRELRLRRFDNDNDNDNDMSAFGKKLIHYYTKHKNKTRREALIKLRKFMSKYF